MSVELDHTLSSHRVDSSSSVPSKASSLPLRSAVESTYLAIGCTSAVTIVFTTVLESQVSYKYVRVESFTSLDHDQIRDLHPELFKRCWLGTNERVVYIR